MVIKLKFLLLFCTVLLSSVPLQAQDLIKDLTLYKAQYTLSISGVAVAKETRSLKKSIKTEGSIANSKNNYIFESSAKTTGLANLFTPRTIKTISHFSLENNRFITQSYSLLEQKSNKIKKDISVDTMINNGLVTLNDNRKKTQTTYLYNGGQLVDTLSLFIALAVDVSLNHKAPVFDYQVVKKSKVSHYQFINDGIHAVKFKENNKLGIKLTRKRGNRHLTVWLDHRAHYLPIVIEHIEKGQTYHYELDSVEFATTN